MIHARARRPIVVAAGVAALLAATGGAYAFWSVGGLGTAVARTGTLDLTGPRAAVRATGRDVTVSWRQARLMARTLGEHHAGGYRVQRYAPGGQRVRGGCPGAVAGPGAALGCVEHGVPDGTWEYAVVPVLGGWSGAEGPRAVVTVGAAAVTVTSPPDGSATRDPRPTLTGTAAGASPVVTVTVTKARAGRAAAWTLTAALAGGSWTARPASDLAEGVYTARARLVGRAGRVAWSRPATFRVDTTAPATTDGTATIGEGWQRTDQVVSLRPADPGGSGVAATYVTSDGSAPTTASPSGSVVSVGEGVHVVRYFSVDRAGNREAVRTAARPIRVDGTDPSAASLGPLPDVVRDGQLLSAGGADALSGVARVVYERCAEDACDAWTPIGSSTTGPDHPVAWTGQPADGSYRVRAKVLDAAGNATTSAPRTVRVDNTPPTVTAVTGADGDGTVEAGDTLTVEATEPVHPVSRTHAGRLTFRRASGERTTMSIAGVTEGPVETGTAAWVADGASVTYLGRLASSDDGRRVRFTVGPCLSGCGQAADGQEGTVRLVPSPSLRDQAGNPAAGLVSAALTLF